VTYGDSCRGRRVARVGRWGSDDASERRDSSRSGRLHHRPALTSTTFGSVSGNECSVARRSDLVHSACRPGTSRSHKNLSTNTVIQLPPSTTGQFCFTVNFSLCLNSVFFIILPHIGRSSATHASLFQSALWLFNGSTLTRP